MLVTSIAAEGTAAAEGSLTVPTIEANVLCAAACGAPYLPMRTAVEPPTTDTDDRTAALDRWLSRTEILVNRAGSTRREWDRHLRPMLARQFEMAAGQHRIRWDGAGDDGRAAGSGVYFVRLQVEGRRWTQSVIRVN